MQEKIVIFLGRNEEIISLLIIIWVDWKIRHQFKFLS